MNNFKKRTCVAITAIALAAFGFVTASRADNLEITHCYSGVFNIFSKTEGTTALLSWTQNGIIISAHPGKLLQGAVTHCDGIQMGLGAARSLHGLCKIVDNDGDVIVAELPWPHKGLDFEVQFLEGTGKWKGITGQLHSNRLVSSPPNKGAMPDTYQTCRRETGSFEVAK